MKFWPFGRINVGDSVVLVDHASWTVNRHLIGFETVVVGLPGQSPIVVKNQLIAWPRETYLVECDSFRSGFMFVTPPCVRKRRGDPDPNSKSSWLRSPWRPSKQREAA